MKLLGAALVAAAFAVLGASEALRMRRRARLTSELAAGLELLRGEIVSRLAPHAGGRGAPRASRPEGTRVFYAAVCTGLESFGGAEFSELWRRALGLLDIGAPARAALLNLGASLGRYGAEEQGSAISACELELRREAERASEEARVMGRLRAGLAAGAGLILAIVLY